MKIESIRLKNFKSFKDAEFSDMPNFCVGVGANGTGKSTIFQVFGFLRDALSSNVNTALAKLGGSRGFDEVRSRNSEGPIEMLAYLTLLYDPKPHPLLCVEEPENQLYPKLLFELAEEFRAYADRGGQVLVSTHSPAPASSPPTWIWSPIAPGVSTIC